MYDEPLRCYAFVNLALSSIQKGVQCAHAVADLHIKYSSGTPFELVMDWSQNHKTLIILNSGFHAGLKSSYDTFSILCESLHLPHTIFYEDIDTMNGMATSFAGIIPESLYTPTFYVEGMEWCDEYKLYEFLKNHSLAS